MFFTIDDTGEVNVTRDAMAMVEVKELHSSDRTKNKTAWRPWIKYIYWVYTRENMFSNMFITERRNEVCRRFFPDKTPEYFESNLRIRNVIKLYITVQYTQTERLYEQWKEDVDAYITYLTGVPYFRRRKDEDGKEYEIPNIDEKLKAQKAIQDLVDTGTKIEQKIFREKKENKGQLNPIFDAPK